MPSVSAWGGSRVEREDQKETMRTTMIMLLLTACGGGGSSGSDTGSPTDIRVSHSFLFRVWPGTATIGDDVFGSYMQIDPPSDLDPSRAPTTILVLGNPTPLFNRPGVERASAPGQFGETARIVGFVRASEDKAWFESEGVRTRWFITDQELRPPDVPPADPTYVRTSYNGSGRTTTTIEHYSAPGWIVQIVTHHES